MTNFDHMYHANDTSNHLGEEPFYCAIASTIALKVGLGRIAFVVFS